MWKRKMMLFRNMRYRREVRNRARRLYAEIARAAREPGFYQGLGVADTLDGRFDLVVLHTHLVLRRLKGAGAQGRALGQALFDTMFGDMDESLRELGVGDLSVGRKIRALTDAFYGRALAYEEALQTAEDDALLKAALMRNVYRGTSPSTDALAALASYVRALDRTLSRSADDAVMAAEFEWPAHSPTAPVSGA
jgi:cytochrome b pre-mRNA-processing protein 3